MAERLCVLILIMGLCLFVAFVIWIVFFMKDQTSTIENDISSTSDEEIFQPNFVEENAENFDDLEDGGEIFIIRDEFNQQRILRPRKNYSW